MTEIILNMSERRYGILLGLVTSACMDAAREGRTGTWVMLTLGWHPEVVS